LVAEGATVAALRARAATRSTPLSTDLQAQALPPLRLALAGGGSGGHVLPGVHLVQHAVAAAALEDLLWFQTGRSAEEAAMEGFPGLLAGAPFERRLLRLEPRGGGAPSLARLSMYTLPSTLAARTALVRHGAQVLLGLGGFTSLPAVLAARSLGVPVALLEINAVEGRATRWLARGAGCVFHAWPGTLPRDADPERGPRHLWTGPPLASDFETCVPPVAGVPDERKALGFQPERPLLVVLGGSQGALGLNRFLAAYARVFSERGVQVLHQVGPGRLEEAATPLPGYRAVEFLRPVGQALRAATMVLCRGGASTLAEVGALQRPAWVVPYPHHADRHQEGNARQLGSGVRIVDEAALDEERARELARLCGQAGIELRTTMHAALEGCVPPQAAQRIWHELHALACSSARFHAGA
jgi:UDP-N-acetylglucosamine:LPS N-acetylglucosamine transferase